MGEEFILDKKAKKKLIMEDRKKKLASIARSAKSNVLSIGRGIKKASQSQTSKKTLKYASNVGKNFMAGTENAGFGFQESPRYKKKKKRKGGKTITINIR